MVQKKQWRQARAGALLDIDMEVNYRFFLLSNVVTHIALTDSCCYAFVDCGLASLQINNHNKGL